MNPVVGIWIRVGTGLAVGVLAGASNLALAAPAGPTRTATVAEVGEGLERYKGFSIGEDAEARDAMAAGPGAVDNTDMSGETSSAVRERRIDLDFQGASVVNALRQLALVGGVNIVIAEDVQGRVTMRLRQVRWSAALDAITRSQGLGVYRSGEILFVDRLERLAAYEQAQLRWRKATEATMPLVTRIIRLSYARADDVAPIIQGLLTERGSVIVDRRTNTLVVTDVASRVDAAMKKIAR